jgi:hypothetical protein
MITTEKLVSLLLYCLVLILAIGTCAFSLSFAFSARRRSLTTLVLAVISIALGLLLTFMAGLPAVGAGYNLIVYLIICSPLVVGCLSLWRWRTGKSNMRPWEISSLSLIALSFLLTAGSYINAWAVANNLLASVGQPGSTPSHYYFQLHHNEKLSPRWVFLYSSGAETGGLSAVVHVSFLGKIKFRLGDRLSGSAVHGIDS